ncbi:DNA gyrase subunit B (plasmid) [Jeotgalibacillus malaysiensis]|uniref:DNA topoisomerase (ATP-hydrolyzing) n=1 Tax=Jeotgalibacillus malaysiensis TaxID=1508404 RepID=A0A0B5AYF2_9BACL|nr:DNA gyrase subunit B [Jeotgalibacillus malaysiensis]AJD93538.1 DNA gyrase subunit B [Jeotgalibacillus malaysiensis]
MTQTTTQPSAYDGSSIDILDGLEAVRKRPGMYIGSTGTKGLHHLVWEIVDNSIDEHLGGHCDTIYVTVRKDNSIEVRDNGRGIPVDVHPKTGYSAARVIFTILHAGGKFNNNGYAFSGGLHGVGASVVNALSTYVEVEVHKNGQVYFDRYENGGNPTVKLNKKGELPIIGETSQTGTVVRFLPDNTIFETTTWNMETIERRMQESAFLNKGLTIVLKNEKTGYEKTFHEEKGIEGFLTLMNEDKNTLTDIISFSGKSNGIIVDIAMQYTSDFSEQVISYCNNITTIEGGTHVTGLRSGLTRLMNNYGKELGVTKETLDGKDIRTGLVAVISIKHPDPQYEGQTKGKLGSTDARSAVEDVVMNEAPKHFDVFVEDAKKILENALRALKMRKAEDKAKVNFQSKGIQLQTNGKLILAGSRNPEECELFIVEGDSAGGTAKTGRDRRMQAILPLRGKVLNVEKTNMDKALKNSEIQTLFSALGCGFGDNFDIKKLRYKKIIILTDADVDGSHIRTLLLTLLYRFSPELIHEGLIYRGLPPLYKVILNTSGKKEVYHYAYSDRELNEMKKEFGSKIRNIQRFKGLGEMNADQLWDTTMNPETRRLGRIEIESAIEADRVTSLLMGEKVEPRRQFIYDHADDAKITI